MSRRSHARRLCFVYTWVFVVTVPVAGHSQPKPADISLILLKKAPAASFERSAVREASGLLRGSGQHWPPHRDDLGHFAEVLGCCGKVELVSCTIGSSQAQAIQFQDALEVSEQHLDLLPLAA